MTWCVYTLVDPRNGTAFYVGITSSPETRQGGHTGDPASAAYNRCYEIKMAGHVVGMEILSEHSNKAEGLAEEARQISTLPGLVNLARSGGRKVGKQPTFSRAEYMREHMKLKRAKQKIPRIEAEIQRLQKIVDAGLPLRGKTESLCEG